MATIVVFGTLDTKGAVHQFLAESIRWHGYTVLVVDVSLRCHVTAHADVPRSEVLRRSGLLETHAGADLAKVVSQMGAALGVLLLELFSQRRLVGVVSVGGRIGMRVAAEGLRALPFGVPSVLVTHAPQAVVDLIETGKDVTLFPSVIKPSGLNRIVRPILKRAARALCTMVEFGSVAKWMSDRPLIVASRFGHAQFGFERAQRLLQRAGYDVVLFTRKGAGGKVMEAAITGGLAAGVLDLSTCELADEMVKGGPEAPACRLEAAGRRGIAAVVAPGGLDAVDFGKGDVPSEFEGRLTSKHGEMLLMRTSVAECRKIGEQMAERLNRYLGPVTVCLPLRGVSRLSGAGQVFDAPEAERALIETLEKHLRKGVRVLRVQGNGEDTPFVERCVLALLENIRRREVDFKMLRGLSFLKNASEVVIRELARLLEAFSCEEGELVQPERGEHEGLYCISQGAVDVFIENETALRLEAGDTYGEQELVFGRTRSVQLRAAKDSEVLFLGCREFEAFCENHPELEETIAALLNKTEWQG